MLTFSFQSIFAELCQNLSADQSVLIKHISKNQNMVPPMYYDEEVYPKISALVKLAQKLVTYNERN